MRMATKKHDLMYQLFGKADGLCKDCEHYIAFRYHDYNRRKCEVYGDTRSEASDWKGKAQACGLYPDKPYNGRNVIELVHGGKPKEDIQIDGQISFGDYEDIPNQFDNMTGSMNLTP